MRFLFLGWSGVGLGCMLPSELRVDSRLHSRVGSGVDSRLHSRVGSRVDSRSLITVTQSMSVTEHTALAYTPFLRARTHARTHSHPLKFRSAPQILITILPLNTLCAVNNSSTLQAAIR
jgi:hypothetical protein